MNPQRRFRRNRLRPGTPIKLELMGDRPLLSKLARANQSRLQRVKRRLQRLLEFVNDRLISQEEAMEEDTPYRISGAFDDTALFVEPGRRKGQADVSSKASPKRPR